MTAPQRTDAQRLEALLKANRIRMARAELKRLLKTDENLVRARRIIRNPPRAAHTIGRELEPALGFRPPPGWLDNMAVADVLLACPSIGGVKARRLMRDAWGHLTVTTRRVGGMREHHRITLADVVERHANRRLDYRSTGIRSRTA